MPPRKTPQCTHDIATVGAAVVDEYAGSDRITIRHIAHATIERHACVPLGAKLNLSSFLTGPGGGAVNAAVTCAHLGLRTAAVVRVGRDLFGHYVLDALRNKGVDIRHAQHDPKTPTGKSLILKAPAGERTIFVYRGANKNLNLVAIPKAHIRPRWFYVTSLAGNISQLHTLLDYAEAIGARVAWNPGMADLETGLRRLLPLLERLDLLILNRDEAAFLTTQPPRHLHRTIKELSPLPKLGLLISDGSKGAYLNDHTGTWFCPPLPGKRIDTTGAGDALGSGTVAGFLHTCNLHDGLRIGMMNALSVIRRPGATEGSLTRFPTSAKLRRIRLKKLDGTRL